MTLQGALIGLLTSHGGNEIQATTSPTLDKFLKAANGQNNHGFAHRGFSWQALNSPAMRSYYGLARDAPGILVTNIVSGGTGSDLLQVGDILVQLGEYVIDPEGTIDHPLYGSMLFSMAIKMFRGRLFRQRHPAVIRPLRCTALANCQLPS